MEMKKKARRNGSTGVGVGVILNRMAIIDSNTKVTFEQSLEGGEGVNCMVI